MSSTSSPAQHHHRHHPHDEPSSLFGSRSGAAAARSKPMTGADLHWGESSSSHPRNQPPPPPPLTNLDASSASSAAYDSSRLQCLIMSKEKELHDINNFRIHTLESLLRDRDKSVAEAQEKLRRLKADFQYNLGLIEERDAELDRADGAVARLQEVIQTQHTEMEALRQAVDEANEAAKRRAARAADDLEAAVAQREEAATQEAAARWRRHEAELTRRHAEQQEALSHEWEGRLLAQEEVWNATEDRLREDVRRLEEARAAQQRALERGEAHESAAREQRAKVGVLTGENKDLRNQLTQLAADHEERMQELVTTLQAMEKAFEQSERHAAADRAARNKAHEEALQAAVRKRDLRVHTAKEQLARSEERAMRAENGLRELRRELEQRVADKARDLEVHDARHATELERKEALLLEVKTQLWETEAEARQQALRGSELAKTVEAKERDIGRLKEQAEHLRALLVEERQARAATAALGGLGPTTTAVDNREEEIETLEAQLRDSRAEAQSLGERVAKLEDEVRKQRRKAEAAATAAEAASWRQQQHDATTNSKAIAEEGTLVRENVRLRSVISDMRHEMERLKFVDAGRERSRGSGAAAAVGTAADGHASSKGNSSSTEEKLGSMLLAENRRLREENNKLTGTCEKLMGISNELNARLNKLSTWAALDQQDTVEEEDVARNPTPPRTKATRRAGAPAPAREEELFVAGRPSASSASSLRRLPHPPPAQASARETQGQKEALSRLKNRKAGVGAATHKVRNYNDR